MNQSTTKTKKKIIKTIKGLFLFPAEYKIRGVIESCADILTTSHWPHAELGKKIQKML
jgi:hypothetical protein